MLVISRQKDGSAAIAENTQNSLSESADNKARGGVTPPTLYNSPPLPRVREEKVLAIRQQLAEGKYDFEQRLDAVLDSLLTDLATQDSMAVCSCSTVGTPTIVLSAEQKGGW